MKLRGIDSLNDAQLLHGQMLLIEGDDRPHLEDDDEFLTQAPDLICAHGTPLNHIATSAVVDAGSDWYSCGDAA